MGYFKQYCLRLTFSQWKWLREYADNTGESMNSFIRRAVRNQINNENAKGTDKRTDRDD